MTRAALVKYAAAHASDTTGGVALLALAAQDAQAIEHRGEVLRELAGARERLPKLADFIDWLTASASFSNRDFRGAARASEAILKQQLKSPLNGQAAILAAKAYNAANEPARALDVLTRAHGDLPQPEGDAAIAGAYDALHDTANAIAYDQRVWLDYPASPQADGAEAELKRHRELLGAQYRPPTAAALLARAGKLIDARDYARARRELTAVATGSPGPERDFALARIGLADQRAHKDALALGYLQALKVAAPEADAERLVYLIGAARRLNRLDVIDQAVAELAARHPKSERRLEALAAAGNEYYGLNRPEKFEPLFQTCYEQFPKSSQAGFCHWRVAFSAYLQDRTEAAALLKTQLRQYTEPEQAARSLYFLGRLAERASNWTEACAWYEQIQRSFPNCYYAVLARERRSEGTIANAAPAPAVAVFLRGVKFPKSRPGTFDPDAQAQERFERARLLRSAALDDFAEMELRFGGKTGDRPEAFGLELARIASSRSAPARGIRYLKHYAPGYLLSAVESAPREFWTLAFPLPWRGPLFEYSQSTGLDPFMVAALIRQESEFDPAVISRANAYGLTQVVPSTGRELSRRMGIRGFTAKSLLEPEMNLRLGTEYLRSLLAQFDGAWEPALASYNAGKSRVVAWRNRMSYREPAEFVESIPFTETRNYVQAVIRNADLYRRLYAP